tara:strand:+ start:743 stop:1249 length:507 start_codon:yes stop_codon:yes gene_type:complete
MIKSKFLITFFLITFFNISAYGENQIVLLDLDYAVSNSNVGKNILQNLNKTRLEEVEKLKLVENSLIKKEQEINKIKNIISKEELNSKISEFQKEIKDFNSQKDQIQKKFINNKNKELEELLKKINPLIIKFMDDNSIEMIISKSNVYLAKTKLDITKNIIELINKNY